MSQSSVRSETYSAQYENLERVRDFVSQAAESCSLEPSAVYAVELAVDEAFTNIIEHAYRRESPDKLIYCECRLDPQRLTVVLRDCGRRFNPKDVPKPDLNTCLQDRQAGGLGLYFIHQLMDEVQFARRKDLQTGKTCNVLTMVKNCKGA